MYLIVNNSAMVRRIPLKKGFEEISPREAIQVDKNAISEDVVKMLKQGRLPGVKIFDLEVARVVKPAKAKKVEKKADVAVTDNVELEKQVEAKAEAVVEEEKQPAAENVSEPTEELVIPDSVPEKSKKKGGKRKGRKKSE